MKNILRTNGRNPRSFPILLACVSIILPVSQVCAADADEVRVREKMKSIMLESLEYRQANIVDVINELNDLAREYHQTGTAGDNKRIDFRLDIEDPDDFWGDNPASGIPPITIKARHVSLLTAFDIIMKESGLDYRISGSTVSIRRKRAVGEEESQDDTGTIGQSQDDAGTIGHPLLSASSLKVVNSFDAKKVKNPAKWKWYCYEPGKAVLSDRTVEMTKLGFKREPKNGPVVMLFDSATGTVYWKWIAAQPAKLFETKDRVNLGEICFGSDPFVEKLWVHHNPDWDHRYKLTSRLWSDEVYGGDITRLDKAMEWIQDDWVVARNPEFIHLCQLFDQQTNQLHRLRLRLEESEKAIEVLDLKIRRSQTDDPWRIDANGGAWKSDDTARLQSQRKKLVSDKKRLASEIDEVLNTAKKTASKIDQVIEDYKRAQAKVPLENAVRKMDFTVSVVLKGGDTR